MKKLYIRYQECIENELQKISYKYRDYRYFLDIGCGDGSRTILFDNYKRKIFGIDRINWIDKKFASKISLKLVDIMKSPLPFKDNYFNIIFSFDVIEHLPKPEMMLQEVKRVLKKDGVFIIITPNRHRFFNLILMLFNLRKFPRCLDSQSAKDDIYAAHLMEYTSLELEQLLLRNGLKIIKTHKLFYGIGGSWGIGNFFSLPFFHNIIIESQKMNK